MIISLYVKTRELSCQMHQPSAEMGLEVSCEGILRGRDCHVLEVKGNSGMNIMI
jgi:hypothetical protein